MGGGFLVEAVSPTNVRAGRLCGEAEIGPGRRRNKMKALLKRFMKDERGLELPEYAVMTALIIAGTVLAIKTLSSAIGDRFTEVEDVVSTAGVAAP
jgi:Flp pilus assembly pilin Flp